MENPKAIRWQERFVNFEKAFKQLTDAVDRIDSLDDLAKEGLIQRFEYTLELAWKTLKDYLEAQEVIAKFPKEVIKQAFQTELISDGELWLEMLKNRNLLSHTYNETYFTDSINKIMTSYYQEIKDLYNLFKNEQ
ncbi:MAG: nucleotidyltransferase substrate binding protein [Marinilabiliaceae bacterium]|nr:nucleotidyltransferase substrate binding protein [Marinilabiliaceae bacterium]